MKELPELKEKKKGETFDQRDDTIEYGGDEGRSVRKHGLKTSKIARWFGGRRCTSPRPPIRVQSLGCTWFFCKLSSDHAMAFHQE